MSNDQPKQTSWQAESVQRESQVREVIAGKHSLRDMSAQDIAKLLRGPRNAFQQQEIRHGLNSEALDRAAEGIPGKYKPGEQASEVNDDGNEPE